MIGLVAGAVFAAAMSTLSSSLNSSATAVVTDFYRPLARPDALAAAPAARHARLTLFFGLVQVLVALGGPLVGRTVVEAVLTIGGFTTGITLGVFFLGIFTTRVGQQAALAGLVLGLATISAVAFGTRLAWPWYTLVGSLSTFGFGWLASLAWPAPRASLMRAPGRRACLARARRRVASAAAALVGSALLSPAPAAAQDWHDAYRAGLAALARGDHARAAEALQRAIALHPEPGRNVVTYGTNLEPRYFPYLRLAEARLALGQLDAAREALERSASWGAREPADERQALPAGPPRRGRRRRPAATPPPATAPPPTPTPAAPTPPTPVPARARRARRSRPGSRAGHAREPSRRRAGHPSPRRAPRPHRGRLPSRGARYVDDGRWPSRPRRAREAGSPGAAPRARRARRARRRCRELD